MAQIWEIKNSERYTESTIQASEVRKSSLPFSRFDRAWFFPCFPLSFCLSTLSLFPKALSITSTHPAQWGLYKDQSVPLLFSPTFLPSKTCVLQEIHGDCSRLPRVIWPFLFRRTALWTPPVAKYTTKRAGETERSNLCNRVLWHAAPSAWPRP